MPGVTLRYLRDSNGLSKLWCFCRACGDNTNVAIAGMPELLDTAVPELRHPCPKCRSTDVHWMPDWSPLTPGHDMVSSSN